MNQQQIPFIVPLNQLMHQFQSNTSTYPPARVRVAMEYLRSCTFKTMSQIACIDQPGGIEVHPGQTLTTSENDAHRAACLLLEQYFDGQLKADQWEKPEIEAGAKPVSNHAGMLLRCIACSPGPIRPDCMICRGCGELLVYPVNSQEGQGSL